MTLNDKILSMVDFIGLTGTISSTGIFALDFLDKTYDMPESHKLAGIATIASYMAFRSEYSKKKDYDAYDSARMELDESIENLNIALTRKKY